MVQNQNIQLALKSWKQILGDQWLIIDEVKLAKFAAATFKTENKVLAVLYPENKTQVQNCLKISNMYKIPTYPISKGKNWGYGSRVPTSSCAVILSLERMNNILDYNETLAYITVEPGVTFQQVYDFLQKKNSTLTPPSIGSTPEASLIGNAVSRGIGKGIYGDRFLHSCNMEVILPSGKSINTGFGHIYNSQSQNVYRWGLGPSIDGLFTQSNYGIVTKMTFWLAPKPGYFQIFFYAVKDNTQLADAINVIRQLRLEGTLTSTATLSNDYRVLAMKQQFPWELGLNTLPNNFIEEIRKKALQGNSWVGDDTIIAPTKAQGKARAKRVKQLLGKVVDKLLIIDTKIARIAQLLHKPIYKFTGVNMREITYFFYNSLYLGIPMEKQLNICYWRKKTPIPNTYDLDRDKCGVIWCSPSIPFTGEHVSNVLNILTNIYKEYGFEPNMGLNLMSDRNIACTSAIIYDREEPEADEKAMACYKKMTQQLAKEGYPPYRIGIQSMNENFSSSEEYVDLLSSIKTTIDPNNILSPGHYNINFHNKTELANATQKEKEEDLELMV